MKTFNKFPTLFLLILWLGVKDIRTDIRDIEHNDFAILPKNNFWRKIILHLLKKYDSDKSVWNSGYISFDFNLEDFLK